MKEKKHENHHWRTNFACVSVCVMGDFLSLGLIQANRGSSQPEGKTTVLNYCHNAIQELVCVCVCVCKCHGGGDLVSVCL